MNTSMGQVAYEAVQQFLASNGIDGDVPPEINCSWEALPVVYREAWEAGAQAVLREWDSQHCAPGVGIALSPEEPERFA